MAPVKQWAGPMWATLFTTTQSPPEHFKGLVKPLITSQAVFPR